MKTFIQKILGLGILVGCLLATYYFETSSQASGLLRVVHWPAILLTGLGPIGVILLCFDPFALGEAYGVAKSANVHQMQEQMEREMGVFQKISHEFYAKGARASEGVSLDGVSQSVRKIVERLGMRMPLTDIQDLLERERLRTEMSFSQAYSLFSAAVKITPSVGMLGTIMGMIQLLSHLKDPSEIGSGMSLALLTTFFGLFFSLVLWSPFQHKVERLSAAVQKQFDQASHWLDLLEQRKPAQYLTEIATKNQYNAPGDSRKDFQQGQRPGLGTAGAKEAGQGLFGSFARGKGSKSDSNYTPR